MHKKCKVNLLEHYEFIYADAKFWKVIVLKPMKKLLEIHFEDSSASHLLHMYKKQ